MKPRFKFSDEEWLWSNEDHFEILDLWLRGVKFFNQVSRFMNDPVYDELVSAQLRSSAKSVMDAIARSRQADSPASVAVWLTTARKNALSTVSMMRSAIEKGIELPEDQVAHFERQAQKLSREIDHCRDRICWHLN